MYATLAPTYVPLLDPTSPAAWPASLRRREPVFVPMSSRPAARTLARLRMVSRRWNAWATFTISDRALAVLARRDPLGLDALDRLPRLAGSTSMDIPYYRFFTTGQKERAVCALLRSHAQSVAAFERRGIACVPLVKGFAQATIGVQVDGMADAGVPALSYYARELLLENDEKPIRRFVGACKRRRVQPVLIGTARRPRDLRTPTTSVSLLHEVAARRKERIDATGRRRDARPGFRCRHVGGWVPAERLASLALHNLHALRAAYERPTTLDAFVAWGG